MRLVGVLVAALGAAGAAYSMWATFEKRRPLDVAFAVAAALAVAVMALGLVLIFVPRFLG